LLALQPELRVVDVRTPVEFGEVHIPQARSVPLGDLTAEALVAGGHAAKDQPLYLICRTDGRARTAATKLDKSGFQPVVVTGGTLAWIAAGLPVVRGSAGGISLERQVRIAAGAMVLAGVLLGWLVNRGFFGFAGLVGGGLIFAGIADFCGMGLLLAKLPWNKHLPR